MGVRVRGMFSAARFALAIVALLCGLGMSPTVSAQPAVVTGVAVRSPVPAFGTPQFAINLRAQGVITGAAPLQINSAAFLINGNDASFLLEPVFAAPNPGSVCIVFLNRDFSPNSETRYSLVLAVSNDEGRDSETIDISFGGGPTTTPGDPACLDAPTNLPPSADAGLDQTVEVGTAVTLDGTGSSDPDGRIVSYTWRNQQQQIIATTATPTVSLPEGTHDLTLTVVDDGQLSSSDTVRIIVRPRPQVPPVAQPGSPRTITDTNAVAGESVTLDGSASSDADGQIVSYQWLNAAGAQVATGPTPTIQLGDGPHDLTLVVTDNDELTGSATVRITVNPPQAPIANAGTDQAVQAGQAATLSGAASSDPDGQIVEYVWTSAGVQLGTGVTLASTFPVGEHEILLTVRDNVGLLGRDTVIVTVTAAPQPPTANAGEDQTVEDTDGEAGELVTLTGSATDPDGPIASYTWTFGETTLTGQTVQARLPNDLTLVTLTVTDSTGLSDTDTVNITVLPPNQPPTAAAGADRTVADSDGEEGERVTLTGTATDADGTVVSYEWISGDSRLGTGATLESVFLPDGPNTITLIVTDDDGDVGEDTVVITVTAPDTPEPQAPLVEAGADRTIVDTDGEGGEDVTLTGTATDPDGGTLTYQWFEGEGSLGTGPTITPRLANGVHIITLVATDSTELQGRDTVQITVNAPSAPTADAGPDQTLPDTNGADGELVTLTGTGTDTDGTIATYEWFEGETSLGTGQTFTTASPLPNGVHTIRLVVTDNVGLTASDTVQVTITAAQAPTANAGVDQTVPDTDGAAGELVTLSGTATDPDGTIASYRWTFGEVAVTGQTVQTRIPDGVTTVTLTVTDSSGVQATDTVQITVAAPALPPTADAGADQNVADADGQLGEVVTLTGTGTDPDGTIASYQWLNGTTVLGSSATLQSRLPDGVSTLTLVVTDDSGLTASDTVQVTVAAPVLPIVNAGVAQTIEDTDVQAGETVQLTGTATTNVGTIARYEWFLGTDSLGVGSSISARLPDGVNLVTLRATSSANAVGSATVQITVATAVRTVLSNIPGLTPNELRLAQKLDEACNNVLGPIAGGGAETPAPSTPGAGKPRPPTQAEVDDFAQKCRGLLLSRDQAALRGAMGQLLGDDFAVARTQTLLFANTQYASVMDRLIALRGGAKGLSLAGLNIIVDGEMVPLADLQDLAKQLFGGGASSDADLWSDKWGLWARGNYSFGKKSDDSLSPSFDANQYALLAGMDYRLSQSAVVGAALAYGSSSVEFNPSSEGSLDTESWALSVYGSLYAKKNFYFDAILNLADSGYQADRNITYVDGYGLVSADANGDTGGLTMSGGVSAGYDFLVGGLTISPTLGVFYIDAQIDEFTETGAGGLNLIYDEQKFKSLTGSLGVRMTFAMNFNWGVLLPHFRADYVREFEDDVNVFGIRFAADPNAESTPPILVETENVDSSYYRLAAGFSAQFKHGISGYVEYQRLESFQFISFQDVSVGLRFQAAF